MKERVNQNFLKWFPLSSVLYTPVDLSDPFAKRDHSSSLFLRPYTKTCNGNIFDVRQRKVMRTIGRDEKYISVHNIYVCFCMKNRHLFITLT